MRYADRPLAQLRENGSPVACLGDPAQALPAALTVSGWSGSRSDDVGSDGRFLMIALVGQRDLVVVQNWVEEVRRLVPPGWNRRARSDHVLTEWPGVEA